MYIIQSLNLKKKWEECGLNSITADIFPMAVLIRLTIAEETKSVVKIKEKTTVKTSLF